MNVTIIEGCIGCGLCTGTCPEVFRMKDDGTAEVYNQPDESQEAAVSESAEGCPVSVIVTGE
ncbi:MAG: ferredoxin [Clostridia bacterium]|nr:ferredoxin [Clostridia bacterium]